MSQALQALCYAKLGSSTGYGGRWVQGFGV